MQVHISLLIFVGLSSVIRWYNAEDFLSAVDVHAYDLVVLHGDFTFVRALYLSYQQMHRHSITQSSRRWPKVLGYVGGPMQCMLKGICAQCLQWQIDPNTGQRTKVVFTCSWQDQPLELVDLEHGSLSGSPDVRHFCN